MGKYMKIAGLVVAVVGVAIGFYIGAESGLTPDEDGNEPLTAGFLLAVAGWAIGVIGAALSIPKPKWAAVLMLAAAVIVVIGIRATWPAAAVLLIAAAVTFMAAHHESVEA